MTTTNTTLTPPQRTHPADSTVSDARLRTRLDAATTAVAPAVTGVVQRVIGLRFDVAGLDLPLGAGVEVLAHGSHRAEPLLGEVVGCGDGEVTCMPFGDLRGLRVGDRVSGTGGAPSVPVGTELLGRVIDAMGNPLDDGPSLEGLPRVFYPSETAESG